MSPNKDETVSRMETDLYRLLLTEFSSSLPVIVMWFVAQCLVVLIRLQLSKSRGRLRGVVVKASDSRSEVCGFES